MSPNPGDIDKLIANRRSVYPKDYTGALVSEGIIRQMLHNANWAPTHKLTEPWRFVVFTGAGLKQLADFQARCYEKVTRNDGTFRDDKYQSLLTKPMLSSHVIAVGMKRDPKHSVPEIEEVGAVFCAVENMYLTATAYGVGCYFSTGGITSFEEAKSFFGLEKEDRLLGFMHVGMPKEAKAEGKRTPVENKVKWVTE